MHALIKPALCAAIFTLAPALAWAERLYVTDVAPIGALVHAIDPDAEVQILTLGADPHAMALRPSHISAIIEADAVIWLGAEFSVWLDAVLDNRERPNLVLTAEQAHAWLDPDTASKWAADIALFLGQIAPANVALFDANAAAVADSLKKTAREIEAQLAPYSDMSILVAHDAYGAFADRFGLNIVGHITDGHDHVPGTSHLGDLHELVEAGGVDCIFDEAGEHNEHAHHLAEEAGAYFATLDPLGQSPEAPNAYATLIKALSSEFAKCGAAVSSE